MHEEEKYHSPDMSKDCGKYSSPRLPEVMDFPRCTNVDTDWYLRMPIDPPCLTQNEILPELCQEEGSTLEVTFPRIDSQNPH